MYIDKFDDLLNRPLSLIRCCHTICCKCFNNLPNKTKCPSCDSLIEETKTNWSVLNQIISSECNKSNNCNVCFG